MHAERLEIVDSLLNTAAEGLWNPSEFDKSVLLRLAGFSYAARGQYTLGQKKLEDALRIFSKPSVFKHKQGPLNMIVTLNALGKIWSWQKDYPKAIEYHKQALELANEQKLLVSIYITQADLAEAHLRMYYEEFDSAFLLHALDAVNNVLHAAKADEFTTIRAKSCAAEALANLGKVTESLRIGIDVLEINDIVTRVYCYTRLLGAIAICTQGINKELSLTCLALCQRLFSEIHYSFGLSKVRKLLSITKLTPEQLQATYASISRQSIDQIHRFIVEEAKNYMNQINHSNEPR